MTYSAGRYVQPMQHLQEVDIFQKRYVGWVRGLIRHIDAILMDGGGTS